MRRATTGNEPMIIANKFQSTLSMRRATGQYTVKNLNDTFQSTLSMRRATDGESGMANYIAISIHALHEESDQWLHAHH